MSDHQPQIEAASAEAWRQWLAQHHDQQEAVWLIIYKKDSGIPSVYYDQAVDEALCFGWIDSKPNKRDATSYFQYFSKRNPKSNWSRVNKEKIQRLRAAGKLAPAGEAMIALAQKSGTWTALDDVENLVLPEDLAAAFAAQPAALQFWEGLPRSVKRGSLEWLFTAKRPATRQKRIRDIVESAVRQERPSPYRR